MERKRWTVLSGPDPGRTEELAYTVLDPGEVVMMVAREGPAGANRRDWIEETIAQGATQGEAIIVHSPESGRTPDEARALRDRWLSRFPTNRFVITSTHPCVIGECRQGEFVWLEDVSQHSTLKAFGKSLDEVVAELFGESIRNQGVTRLTNEAGRAVQDQAPDRAAQIEALEQIVGENGDVVRLKTLDMFLNETDESTC